MSQYTLWPPKVSSINGVVGPVTIAPGTGINVGTSGQTITISNTGVTSLNAETGAINLVAGANITITPVGQNITIAATSGGTPLVFTSNPGGAGSATVVFVIPGLLATDTILAVTPKISGSTATSANALTGFDTLVNNGLTVHYGADPGTGSVVIVAVTR